MLASGALPRVPWDLSRRAGHRAEPRAVKIEGDGGDAAVRARLSSQISGPGTEPGDQELIQGPVNLLGISPALLDGSLLEPKGPWLQYTGGDWQCRLLAGDATTLMFPFTVAPFAGDVITTVGATVSIWIRWVFVASTLPAVSQAR
jgi:hypothetical protein